MNSLAKAGAGALVAATVALAVPKFSHLYFGTVPVQLSDFLVAIGMACALVVAATQRSVRRSPIYIGFGIYLAAAVLSLTNVDSTTRGLIKIVGIMSLMAAPTAALHVVRDRATWDRLYFTWVGTACVVGAVTVLAALGYFFGWKDPSQNVMLGNFGSLPPGRIPRMEGPFLNSNQYSNYLGVSLCLWAGRAPFLARRFGRPVALGMGSMIALALPFTLSPNLGAVAFSCGLFVVLASFGPRWLRGVAIVGAGLTMVAFFVATAFIILPAGPGLKLGPLGYLSGIPSGRVAASLSALETIQAHPLLGGGVGEPVAHFHHEYAAQGAATRITEFHLEAHNFYLGLWAQMGPLALGGFLTVVFVVLRGVLRLPAAGAQETRWIRAGLAAAICGQLLYGGLFGGFEDSRHIWMMLALSLTAPGILTGSSARSPDDTSRRSDTASDEVERRQHR